MNKPRGAELPEPTGQPKAATAAPAPGAAAAPAAHQRGRFAPLRGEISPVQAGLMGLLCLALCGGLWWYLTQGEAEQRILSPAVLPSPAETFADFPRLWFDQALTRNLAVSLRRVVLGFGLAALVGVPIGVLCGCFPRINAFFLPVTVVGRNIPVAALIPLTFSLFGIGEFQKIMFLFIACVAFVIMDSANAIAEIDSRYIDTAYTLGARRWQIIRKVLVPLAMPNIFNSLRLLFGLAFGYIMLAELVKLGGATGGLGDIISISQRRGYWTYILLVLMIIPLVALAIDRLWFWVQRQLFPAQYGGSGLLRQGVRALQRACEDLVALVRRPAQLDAGLLKQPTTSTASSPASPSSPQNREKTS